MFKEEGLLTTLDDELPVREVVFLLLLFVPEEEVDETKREGTGGFFFGGEGIF